MSSMADAYRELQRQELDRKYGEALEALDVVQNFMDMEDVPESFATILKDRMETLINPQFQFPTDPGIKFRASYKATGEVGIFETWVGKSVLYQDDIGDWFRKEDLQSMYKDFEVIGE